MNKKIILTESQYETLKFFILESTFDKLSRTVIKKGDFVQIETQDNVLNFEVIESYGGQIYMRNIDKNTDYYDKLVFIGPASFVNNQIELKVANEVQKNEKNRNPRSWQRINVKNVNRIDVYRGDELIDSTENIESKEQKPTETEPETEKKDDKLLSLGLDAYNEILNDPNLKKAFYKKPSFWNLFMAELKGKKATGSGIVPALQLLDDYHETKLANKFILRGLILFNIKTPVTITTDKEVFTMQTGVKYVARVNQEKIDGKWVFENRQADFKVVVYKEINGEPDTFKCKIIKYYYGKEYKEFESDDYVDIIITKQDSNGYNPTKS
jgi:hypothetical protein